MVFKREKSSLWVRRFSDMKSFYRGDRRFYCRRVAADLIFRVLRKARLSRKIFFLLISLREICLVIV